MTDQTQTEKAPPKATRRVLRLSDCGLTVGSSVMTKSGACQIEDLKSGDVILTKDCGYQKIGCIAFRDVDLLLQPDQAPVRIAPHALGHDKPNEDAFVSPDQRIALRHPVFEGLFGRREVLLRARDMTHLPGIEQVQGLRGITYVTVGLAQPQLVFSGALTLELGAGGSAGDRPILSAEEAVLATDLLRPQMQPDMAGGFPLH